MQSTIMVDNNTQYDSRALFGVDDSDVGQFNVAERELGGHRA